MPSIHSLLDLSVVPCVNDSQWTTIDPASGPYRAYMDGRRDLILSTVFGLQLPEKYKDLDIQLRPDSCAADRVFRTISKAHSVVSTYPKDHLLAALERVQSDSDAGEHHLRKVSAAILFAYRTQMRVLQYAWSSNDPWLSVPGLDRASDDLLSFFNCPAIMPAYSLALLYDRQSPTTIGVHAAPFVLAYQAVLPPEVGSASRDRHGRWFNEASTRLHRFSTDQIRGTCEHCTPDYYGLDTRGRLLSSEFAQFLCDLATVQQRLTLTRLFYTPGPADNASRMPFSDALSRFSANL